MHTNLDIAGKGLNDYLAALLELRDIKELKITKEEILYKIVVYIPEDHFETVKDAILKAGAGFIGNYSHTSFSQTGEGTFKPLNEQSFSWRENKINRVREYRFETIVREENLKEVFSAIEKYHPYEEPAVDLFSLVIKKLNTV